MQSLKSPCVQTRTDFIVFLSFSKGLEVKLHRRTDLSLTIMTDKKHALKGSHQCCLQ